MNLMNHSVAFFILPRCFSYLVLFLENSFFYVAGKRPISMNMSEYGYGRCSPIGRLYAGHLGYIPRHPHMRCK
uniref:Putative secreted protein n=1 Tax=Ixodes ricinus TaxID=34613 RepID=A0A6B0U3X3_IXORI